ncbi:PepSY-associated TM helix domain-containing protein [Sphingobacterium corticibacterium]|uniref:PepSY domain-containing protein n=1 Tax=Sphingobacterium corticibacterium TaxID=2484746 RepID=A0A4Q6XR19_9SPHI|nr:PepSY-associated TM helix domain-containing protein [Sphingobacterium corticibacterium]RZF59902.1 PepSY domain-containing protein [Sphingobacterium corticibacterium]
MKKKILKVNAWLHLWFGLVSGVIVIILSITGCVLVFQEELKYLFSDYTSVIVQDADSQLPPSRIYQSVKERYPDKEIVSAWYWGLNKSVRVSLEGSDHFVYVNPYTADIIAEVPHEDVFHFMDEGHRHLWMSPQIGRPIVGWATFIFFFITGSGLILWWPKKWTKRMVKQSFRINWKARFKRINYDLHNVLGFYSLTLALLMAFTGLIMSFPWLRQSVVWMTGGYPTKTPVEEIQSSENYGSEDLPEALYAVDYVWVKVRKSIALHNKEAVIVHFPHEHTDEEDDHDHEDEPLYACTDMINGTWRDLSFDRQTLALLPSSSKPMHETGLAEWIMRSNYGLHTGYIGGITTKILYFFASLICASLPITGFYIWWGKRQKTSKKRGKN